MCASKQIRTLVGNVELIYASGPRGVCWYSVAVCCVPLPNRNECPSLLPTLVIHCVPWVVVLLPSVAESGDLVVPLPTLVVCGLRDKGVSRMIGFDYSDLVPSNYSDLVPMGKPQFRPLVAIDYSDYSDLVLAACARTRRRALSCTHHNEVVGVARREALATTHHGLKPQRGC